MSWHVAPPLLRATCVEVLSMTCWLARRAAVRFRKKSPTSQLSLASSGTACGAVDSIGTNLERAARELTALGGCGRGRGGAARGGAANGRSIVLFASTAAGDGEGVPTGRQV